MKTKVYLIIFLGMIIFNSCKKDRNEETPAPTPTSLELTLVDNLGNAVSGASVKLFSSESDWSNQTNQVGMTQTSDASGKVKFTGLTNIQYYWFAQKDCYNNVYGAITTSTTLTANTNNTANVVLSSSGTIKLISTSSNPYKIYINGNYQMDMQGGATKYFYYVPSGSYSIEVVQISGYVLYPTDETFNVTVSCGTTSTVTFP